MCPLALMVVVSVFSYSPRFSENDSTPWITACGTRPEVGTVAVSQDLFGKPGWGCGDRITVNGRDYIVADTMNARHRTSVDIWNPNTDEALRHGVKVGVACVR